MNISLVPGTYVAAVSGGVDSMVLLDLLCKRPGIKVIVAHFDHGIRPDSHKDRLLVQQIAKERKLPFVHDRGQLGPDTSEEKARKARYAFLRQVKNTSGARAIIMAHHADDLLETAIHNLLRGSGRRGLTSLRDTDEIVRPLLGYHKDRLKDYARSNRLAWREDSTNEDTKYRRNYIRHRLLSRFSDGKRAELKILVEQLAELNDYIDGHLINFLHLQPAINVLDRNSFIKLPHKVAKETMHFWLKHHNARDLTNKQIENLVVRAKTAANQTSHDIDHKLLLKVVQGKIIVDKRPDNPTVK